MLTGYQQAEYANKLTQQLSGKKQEKQQYTRVIRQIKKLEKDKALLDKRIDIIHRLKAESSLTVHILDEVAHHTPSQRMWLTSLTQTGNNLKLAGMALDNRTIAKYMEELKGSPYIQSVNLASTSLKAYAGRNLKSFSIACAIGIPAEEKKPEKK